jgi:putative ABC transport system permease protein
MQSLDKVESLSQLGLHAGQLLTSVLVAAVVVGIVAFLLRSEWGLVIRALGSHPRLLAELRHKPSRLQAQGLALANGLVGLAAALIVSRQGFVDINMAVGIVITLIASLVIGEAVLRIVRIDPARSILTRMLGVFLGAVLYFMLYIFILRASILGWIPVEVRPTDLKLLSALAVVIAVSIRNRKSSREEVLPF